MLDTSVKPLFEYRILLVDDDRNVCRMLKEILDAKYSVDTCLTATSAFEKIDGNNYDIVITDLKLDDGSGIDVLKHAKERDKYTEVIIITGYGSFETAFEAINLGVTSYLNKPLKLNEFCLQVEKAIASRIFHLKSLRLITHSEAIDIPNVREHILDITSLNYISSKLMLSLDVPEVMRIILGDVNDKLDAQFSVIGVDYLKFREMFAMTKNDTINPQVIRNSIVSLGDDIFQIFPKEELISEKIPLKLFTQGKTDNNNPNHLDFNNFIGLPMTILGETIGFIALFFRDKDPLSKERKDFFHVFTSIITSAVQHCYMDMLARQQAKTDSLTGVANHRMFHEILDRELARMHRIQCQFCLAMIDIDDFKKINDTYGHLIGDAILIDLTSRITKTIRSGDVLARYGGEEFALILFDTDLSGAEKLAKRVCQSISKRPFVYAKSSISYTVSIGLVASNKDKTQETSDYKNTMIGLADQALYEAKRKGKNRVETIGS